MKNLFLLIILLSCTSVLAQGPEESELTPEELVWPLMVLNEAITQGSACIQTAWNNFSVMAVKIGSDAALDVLNEMQQIVMPLIARGLGNAAAARVHGPEMP